MNLTKLFVLLIALLLLVVSCANRQEDADQLEKDMLAQQEPVDTADATAVPLEVIPEEAEVVDPAAVPDESESTIQPTVVSGDGYTVQIAACEDLSYAQGLVEQYLKRGYDSYMTTFTFEGQTYYRVRTGKFETRVEAEAVRDKLIDKYSIDAAWIDGLSE